MKPHVDFSSSRGSWAPPSARISHLCFSKSLQLTVLGSSIVTPMMPIYWVSTVSELFSLILPVIFCVKD